MKSFIRREMERSESLINDPSIQDKVGLEALHEMVDASFLKLRDFQTKLEGLNQEILADMKTANASGGEIDQEAETAAGLVYEMSDILSKLGAMRNRLCRKIDGKAGDSRLEVEKERLALERQRLDLETSEADRRRRREEDERNTVKLPDLPLETFHGDLLKWGEFKDHFDAAIDRNQKLSDVQKLNYLKSKLGGEAKGMVSSLRLTNGNYRVAMKLLEERFGNKQMVVSALYNELINLPSCSNETGKLRVLYDKLEEKVRSLEALGEDPDQSIFISVITSKIPRPVMTELELKKPRRNPWTVDLLRKALEDQICAREAADRQTAPAPQKQSGNQSGNQPRGGEEKKGNPSGQQRTTTQALGANERQGESPSDQQKRGGNQRTPRTNKSCIFCTENHFSDQCKKFANCESRKEKIKGRCFICLNPNHLAGACEVKTHCYHCGKPSLHHRSLCPKAFPAKGSGTVRDNTSPATEVTNLVTGSVALFPTAMVEMRNTEGGPKKMGRIGFDSFSSRTYATKKFARALKLPNRGDETLETYTFASDKTKDNDTFASEIEVFMRDGTSKIVSVNVVEVVGGPIRRGPWPMDLGETASFVRNLVFADPPPLKEEDVQIDLLVGIDFYYDFMLTEMIHLREGTHLVNSKFGWMFTGRIPRGNPVIKGLEMSFFTIDKEKRLEEQDVSFLTQVNQVHKDVQVFESQDSFLGIPPSLEDFSSLQVIGIKDSPQRSDDDRALEKFQKSVNFKDDRYHVSFPWKEEIPDLPTNYELALGRLKSLLKRLSKDKDMLERYNGIIQDQLSKGIIERVTPETVEGSTKHYIPHHPVVTPSKATTKVRIVYDASAKSRKTQKSLNECMDRGPVFLEDLTSLLMRFRLYKIGITADIEKAFLNVGVNDDNRDFLRFLWIKDPTNPNVVDNLEIFRFCRVPFGVIASPFLLGATIDHHLKIVDSDIAEKLRRFIYVDNVIAGEDLLEEACKFYQVSKKIFNEILMNLREWISNSEDFMKQLNPADKVTVKTAKVLGILWLLKTDSLTVCGFNQEKWESVRSKRDMLQVVAAVFDPLGLFNPVTIGAKLFIQSLWKEKLGWDDKIEEGKLRVWKEATEGIKEISSTPVPRFICTAEKEGACFDLLCFTDASAQAYSANVYLRVSTPAECKVNLIFSKTRLAPSKAEITIPRLELLGVLIGIRMLNFIQTQLNLPIGSRILWTDSQCVLHWIKSSQRRAVFVENRLREIKEQEDVNFRFIPGEMNPADQGTRICSKDDFFRDNQLWWHGPKWLQESPMEGWPNFEVPVITPEVMNAESKKESSQVIYEVGNFVGEGSSSENKIQFLFELEPKNFSSLSRLLRVTAWTMRFVSRLLKRKVEDGPLKVEEISQAKELWEQNVQERNFPEVFTALRKRQKNELVNQFGLQLDDKGILRCHGRLENAGLAQDSIFPKLLPKKDGFTDLIISSFHKRLFHSGVAHTVSQLRMEYWLPRARTEVRRVLLKCQICRRQEGGPYKAPVMPSLPRSRVSKFSAFSNVGLDYLGPLYVKEIDGSTVKVYVCLYTCLTVRAVTLELIRDLSAEHFLLGFRRFIASRGKPKRVLSDNAPQFKLTKSAVDKLWSAIFLDGDFQSYISNEGIQWSFTPELSPWMGGVYERLVGLVKRSLRKSIGKVTLSFDQLRTLLKEIQAVLNSRPLVYIGSEFENRWTLCPADFITMNPKTGFAGMELNLEDPDFQDGTLSSKDKLLDTWKKGQAHLDQFWKLWSEDYLLSLRERRQRDLKGPRVQSKFEPKEGDIVLVKELYLPRGSWKIARIENLIKSSDGLNRSAKLRLPNGKFLNRSVSFLYPLECSISDSQNSDETLQNEEEKNSEDEVQSSAEPQPSTSTRPQRKTAIVAKEKLAQWMRQLR